MNTKETAASKLKKRPKVSLANTPIPEMLREGSKEESKRSRKQGSGEKKKARSMSEGRSPAESMAAHHKRYQSTDEREKTKPRSSSGSEKTSRNKGASGSPCLGQVLTKSGQTSFSSLPGQSSSSSLPGQTSSSSLPGQTSSSSLPGQTSSSSLPGQTSSSSLPGQTSSSSLPGQSSFNSILGQSSTNTVPKLCVSHESTDDEGINMVSPKSSINSVYSDASSTKRKRNNQSMTSSTSSFHYSILEGQEEDEQSNVFEDANKPIILQENDPPANAQENNPSNTAIFIAPNLHLKEDHVDSDSDPSTSMIGLLTCDAVEKKPQAPPKLFPAQHSATPNSDISPFDPMEPLQATSSEGVGHCARNFLYDSSSNFTKDDRKRLQSFSDVMRETAVAIIRDNFDKVEREFDNVLDNNQTKYEALQQEHRRLKEQHEMEKQYLSNQIQTEREERIMESTVTCNLTAELEKHKEEVQRLKDETREFQQIKEDMKSLRESLAQKQTELDKLRMTMESRSENLRSIVLPIETGPEQLDQMKESEERLEFLMRMKPNKQTFEQEIRRYEYRTQQRPYTK